MLRLYYKSLRIFVYARFRTMSGSTNQNQNDWVDLGGMRKPYFSEEAHRGFSEKDPLKLFESWFNLACNTDGIKEANAMALATADSTGKPSIRYVLLKGYGRDGFRFCTNYESRKGKEIAENPKVSLLFYWEALSRQIRIEGTVVKMDDKESEDYFHSRPRSSQISAIVSNQSAVIESPEVLVKRHRELEEEYSDESKVIPKPNFWGGYKVIPEAFEFWCGRTNRLHDRLRFRQPAQEEKPDNKFSHLGENGWIYEYLSP